MIETQTIDITHVQKILSHCPNYDYIVNYDYEYGDVLTSKLIDWYRELIFSVNGNDANQLKIIEVIDKSLYLYIKDNKYKKGLRKLISIEEVSLENKSLIREVIRKLILFTNDYENEEMLDIGISKWL